MKYFIDTADVAEIREAASWGLIDGVTTNPSLMAKTGRPYHDVLKRFARSSTARSARKSSPLKRPR